VDHSGKGSRVSAGLKGQAVSLLVWLLASKAWTLQREDGSSLSDTSLDHHLARARAMLKLPTEFVLHSLRHSFETPLGELGAKAFTIMRLMGHSTVTVSQRYVHPSPEAMERAFQWLTAMNLRRIPTNSPAVIPADSSALQ